MHMPNNEYTYFRPDLLLDHLQLLANQTCDSFSGVEGARSGNNITNALVYVSGIKAFVALQCVRNKFPVESSGRFPYQRGNEEVVQD
jgi:hypothetical protein